jgi:hypothetical protein
VLAVIPVLAMCSHPGWLLGCLGPTSAARTSSSAGSLEVVRAVFGTACTVCVRKAWALAGHAYFQHL